MLTKWGEALDREHPLPEYPRPQLVRDSYLNLNGSWDFAFCASDTPPEEYGLSITVPFSPETELSGVGRAPAHGENLWYRRELKLPEGFNRGRVLLHIDAADQFVRLWVNGKDAGTHMGGYLPFTADITELLGETNELVIRVTDDTDSGFHTRGKQSSKPSGIWYTAQSGIWQTVWCESVPEKYIESLRITPRFDEGAVDLLVGGEGQCTAFVDSEEFTFEAGEEVRIELFDPHPWSPEDPYLYRFRLTLGEDTVESYFALRKVSVEKDSAGVKRLFLNGSPYFMSGVLDQGYWPDGLYTAPSDEALAFDIASAKAMGFNTLRKHIKVEPLRWYWHCDRLGMLVWQDMPNGGGKYAEPVTVLPLFTGAHRKDNAYRAFARKDERGREEFTAELAEMITHLYNCPCIVLWTVFNEGWGQFDAEKHLQLVRELDETRLIDHASGWHDQGVGELRSIHLYFDEYRFKADKKDRAVILSEFGGYTCPIEGHCAPGKVFSYKKFKEPRELRAGVALLYDGEIRPAVKLGLAACIYTQLTDVEGEINGFITYDRAALKLSAETVERITRIPKLLP